MGGCLEGEGLGVGARLGDSSWESRRAAQRGGAPTAKVTLHPPPVSIKLLISILTTQLIRLCVLNYDRVPGGGGAAPSAHSPRPPGS